MPILIIATIIMFGVFGILYFYLNAAQADKPEFIRRIEDKINRKVNMDYQVRTPAEVAITKNGFVPATISIVAGQQVTFVNQDKNAHRILPYPLATRSLLPELDSEDLQPTDSFTYSFERMGTFTISENINLGKYKATVIVN